MPGFGRRPEAHETARALSLHPVSEHALAQSRIVTRKTTVHGLSVPALNQKETGTCEGHAWEHALLAAPIEHRVYPDPNLPGPFDIYRGACTLDEWPENDNGDLQAGTSTRACAAWLASQGVIGHYDWCASAVDVANWIGARDRSDRAIGGPVIIGVDWYWDDVEPSGFLSPSLPDTQHPLGGHAVALIGWNEIGGYFVGINSWGPEWGLRHNGKPTGRFYMGLSLLDRLLRDGGDACAPIEIRRHV